jgi:hypothetical protein
MSWLGSAEERPLPRLRQLALLPGKRGGNGAAPFRAKEKRGACGVSKLASCPQIADFSRCAPGFDTHRHAVLAVSGLDAARCVPTNEGHNPLALSLWESPPQCVGGQRVPERAEPTPDQPCKEEHAFGPLCPAYEIDDQHDEKNDHEQPNQSVAGSSDGKH